MTIELTPIPLHHPSETQQDAYPQQSPADLDLLLPVSNLTRFGAWNLYLSHALSTWNARIYEFGATLFTASAFPNTLFAQSMRGLCTTFAALCLSSFVGRWIDKAPSRIRTLLITISANRVSVLVACLGWIFLVPGPLTSPSSPSTSTRPADLLPGLIRRTFDLDIKPGSPTNKNGRDSSSTMKVWVFAIVIGLGICENLSGIGNMIAMEREWVPILAATTTATTEHPQSPSSDHKESPNQKRLSSSYTLTHLNAVTRRIDLLCKLFAPVFISLVILCSSMFIGVVVVGCTSTLSWGIEIWCARRVWRTNPSLQRPKIFTLILSTPSDDDGKQSWRKWIPSALYSRQKSQLKAFFATDIWMPALSLTMLHFSVLAYSATFITFLLNSGFSLFSITSARVISSIVEVSSTFVAPMSIRYFAAVEKGLPGMLLRTGGKKKMKNGLSREEEEGEGDDDEEQQEGFLLVAEDDEDEQRGRRGRDKRRHLLGLARSGLWGINLQLGCLVPVVLAISQIRPSSPLPPSLFITIPMFSFLCLSRLGLWVFDISIQELSQICVRADSLASFAGTNMSFVAAFELCQWVLVAIVSRPEEFIWLGTVSAATVAGALGLYVFWFVRRGAGRGSG